MKKLTVAFVNAVLLTRTEFYVSFRSRNESTHGAWIFSVIMIQRIYSSTFKNYVYKICIFSVYIQARLKIMYIKSV